MAGVFHRLYTGETTINFFGRRRVGFTVSLVLLIVSLGSLLAQGLNLGIDFKGGVAFEAPASGGLTVAKVESVVTANGVELRSAKIQVLSSGSDKRIRLQLGDQPASTVSAVQKGIADAGKIETGDVSVASVSSTWGWNITKKALYALVIFLFVVSFFIAWQFKWEWSMSMSAMAAVLHDVGISVGVYSLLGLEVTPATVVAFLTILGFSLYDTIVVFDKVNDNVERFSGSRVSYGDVINVSMNQVLMRSLNTSIAAVFPVLSLLVLGSFVLGAVALEEFAVALLVGLVTGAYSSIFIASPLLGILKERTDKFALMRGRLSVGTDLAHLMKTGTPLGRKGQRRAAETATETSAPPATSVETVLSHPPRPRKKARR